MSDGLDPSDWTEFRTLAHEILDEMVSYVRDVDERPVWREFPEDVHEELSRLSPETGEPTRQIWKDVQNLLLPYTLGNLNPRFYGWIHGAGTPVGVIAEMIAAAINANVGGRQHAPVLFERQVLDWSRDLFEFPGTAGGILTSGTSMANVIGLAVARGVGADSSVRDEGLYSCRPLRVYASEEAHISTRKALELLGMGAQALVEIPTGQTYRIRTDDLEKKIEADRRKGYRPVCVVGSAGTVNTGAVDNLSRLAEICRREGLWFHVDGAFGAALKLTREYAGLLDGIERADSLAFDFHKWFHVPYDAGCLLTRDAQRLHETFAADASYLLRQKGGPGGAAPWFADRGPELSRGFRALKVWFTWRAHGTRGLGEAIEMNVRQAHHLGDLVAEDSDLELLAPVETNVVCFRYRPTGLDGAQLDALNTELILRVQKEGHALPSSAMIDGAMAIRAAVTNHRTRQVDIEALLNTVKSKGREILRGRSRDRAASGHE